MLEPLGLGPVDVMRSAPPEPAKPVEPVVETPVVSGFDASLSVEDVGQRDVFVTVFDNVDGTETAGSSGPWRRTLRR